MRVVALIDGKVASSGDRRDVGIDSRRILVLVRVFPSMTSQVFGSQGELRSQARELLPPANFQNSTYIDRTAILPESQCSEVLQAAGPNTQAVGFYLWLPCHLARPPEQLEGPAEELAMHFLVGWLVEPWDFPLLG
jgi:hypothetical protein